MKPPSPTLVLHVEDSPTDVLLTREELKPFPQFQLRQVSRLDDALRVLESSNYAVVLLDLGLPDSKGLETLLRLQREAPQVPVVVMTGNNDEELALRALQNGAQDYLVKGRPNELLLDRILRYAIERNLAKQALLEREELFRAAFDDTAVAMVLTDIENIFLRVNDSFARMFGYTPNEMIGMTMASVTHPEDLADSLARRESLLAGTAKFFHTEKRYLHRDGSILWGLTNVSIVRDPKGRPHSYVGQVQDITSRRTAELERDRLFEESVSLLGLLGFNGQFLRLNSAWERTLGYTLPELLAEPFITFVHPDDRAATMVEVGRQVEGFDTHSFENRVRCKDGTYRVLLWSATPVAGEMCFSVSGHDVTERRRVDEALRLRDRAMQSVTQGILITDPNLPDNPIIYASPGAERLTGYRAEEFIGRNCRFLQGPDTDPEAVRLLREAIASGRERTVELLNYRKDGKTFWNSLHLAPVRDDQGRIVNIVGVQIDVTERRTLEEQLRQAQKMEAVGQLAGGVAHDFNNLLTIISGYSEILLMSLPPENPLRSSIVEIGKAGERAAGLTRQLLTFSRQTIFVPQVLDLNEVVQEAEKMLRRLIGEDIALTVVLDPRSNRVKVDPGQMGQVLMNLVVNARDAMPRGGHLTIETKNVDLDGPYINTHVEVREGRYVLLTVTDTGTGMPPEVRNRIFEPFYTTKGIGRGTGLGLSVVHGIVKQSDGYIGVYSEPGIGTTFKVYLPAVESGETLPATGFGPNAISGGHETVLLVEDEDGVRAMALVTLQTQGYTVLSAENGKEALRVLKKHAGSIDILVTDVVMPEMSGPELAEALRPQYPEMKVLYLSGYTDDAVVRHGILQAEVAFLQKPYTPMFLLRKLRAILDRNG